MHRRTLLGAVALASAGTASSARARTIGRDDAAEVRLIVSELEASWNAGDAERMYRLATDDIEWVNIMGMYWRGKAQVQAAHHAILTTRYKGVRETLEEIESVRPMGDDAVVVVIRWRIDAFTAPDGAAMPASQTRMTLICRRTPDGLRMAHAANIEINQRAAAGDPAKRSTT